MFQGQGLFVFDDWDKLLDFDSFSFLWKSVLRLKFENKFSKLLIKFIFSKAFIFSKGNLLNSEQNVIISLHVMTSSFTVRFCHYNFKNSVLNQLWAIISVFLGSHSEASAGSAFDGP